MLRFIQVTVVVLMVAGSAVPQDVSVNANLQFGTVFPGVPEVVDKTSSGAAVFEVSGTADAEITLDFVLPTYMYAGGKTMRMVFSDTDCAMDSSSSPDQSAPGYDDLNPWTTITYRIGSSGLTVWLGGKVVPDLTQQPGSYTADITLTVAYTGN